LREFKRTRWLNFNGAGIIQMMRLSALPPIILSHLPHPSNIVANIGAYTQTTPRGISRPGSWGTDSYIILEFVR